MASTLYGVFTKFVSFTFYNPDLQINHKPSKHRGKKRKKNNNKVYTFVTHCIHTVSIYMVIN